jgi:3-methylcrotonyl-CoA carboxylase beta subunit
MWPNAKIAVMGGEQAASVLAQVKREKQKRLGNPLSQEEEQALIKRIMEKYGEESSAYYSSARLWDDGVIDPARSREVIGLSLAISTNAPIAETKFGLFRM